MNKQTLAAIVFGVSLAAMPPASAQPVHGEQRQYVVQYSDLDVTRDEGARVLLMRLRIAARIVCSPAGDSIEPDRVALHEFCIKDTTDRAVAAAHVPLVSALYGSTGTAIAEN